MTNSFNEIFDVSALQMEETSRRDLFLFDFISFEISEKQILSPFFLSGDRIIFSESVYNLPASEIVIISSLSASLLNLTVSIDPNTACCIETIVKNKANGERIIFYLMSLFELKVLNVELFLIGGY